MSPRTGVMGKPSDEPLPDNLPSDVETGLIERPRFGPEPDWDGVLYAIRGSRNTLGGWVREMEGYDDAAMKRALSAAWHRPDPRIKSLKVYRAMVDNLERELRDDGLPT